MKGAIFDMDGTLVDSLGYFDTLWGNMGKKFIGNPDFFPGVEEDRHARTMLLRDSMYEIQEKFGLARDGEELYRFADEALLNHYKNVVTPKPYALELLDYLRGLGVKMCIASATEPQLIKYALEKCGMTDYFDIIVSCADVGCGKESPKVFYRALEVLGTSIDDTFVFEDSLVAIRTATDAGFHTVSIYDSHNFGQDEIKERSDYYIGKGETFEKVIGRLS
jgi:HAD superfamily hydrolase (TIGR01509 family)